MDDETVKAFASLFKGRRDAYGLRHGESVREKVTLATYRRHLDGEVPTGIYPVLDDGTCHFAAVDFDRKSEAFTPQQIDTLAMDDAGLLMEECERLGLNGLWLERSKSKGSHVWIFFDSPVKAADIRRILIGALAAVKITHYDLFPRQDTVNEKAPLGNYINCPYPGGDNESGRQMMLDRRTFQPLPLTHFLKIVERFPADSLDLVLTEVPERENGAKSFGAVSVSHGKRPTWYPCGPTLLNVNLAEGEGRNDLGFLIARRIQVSPFGEAGKAMYDEWNQSNQPPLSTHEADRTWHSAERYDGMGCEKVRGWQQGESERVQATCVDTCPIHPSRGASSYHRLRKEQTDPPTYYLAVNGEDIRLSPEELWKHQDLRLAAMTQINRVVPAMKDPPWWSLLQDLLNEVKVLFVPPEMTPRGQLWSAMTDWLSVPTEDEEQIEAKPVERDGVVYFKLRGLTGYLRRQGLTPKQDVMWSVLKDHDGCNGTARFSGKVHRVWSLPASQIEGEALQEETNSDSRNAVTRNAPVFSERNS